MKEKAKQLGKSTFAALAVRNYRLYFIGQAVSITGNWLQTVAQVWLVYKLTGSGTDIGLLLATQFLPMLVLGPAGGLIADRFPKYRIIRYTQLVSAFLAATMAVLVLTHVIQIWMIFLVALGLGLVNVVDNPTRQTLVREMVGNELITNAVTLGSVEINLARMVGPAIAAALIASSGIGWCFIGNALSFIVVLGCLYLIRPSELESTEPLRRGRGQLREGFRYVWRTPVLRNVLLMMAVVGTFSYEFQVSLPLIAAKTFHAGARGYSTFMITMGLGSIVGGLLVASRKYVSARALILVAAALGVTMLVSALSPSLALAAILFVPVGFATVAFSAMTNSSLQINADASMRGRVMSLWTVAYLGSTPIGGPIVGWIGDHFGARWSIIVGSLAALVAASLGLAIVRRAARQQPVVAPETV